MLFWSESSSWKRSWMYCTRPCVFTTQEKKIHEVVFPCFSMLLCVSSGMPLGVCLHLCFSHWDMSSMTSFIWWSAADCAARKGHTWPSVCGAPVCVDGPQLQQHVGLAAALLARSVACAEKHRSGKKQYKYQQKIKTWCHCNRLDMLPVSLWTFLKILAIKMQPGDLIYLACILSSESCAVANCAVINLQAFSCLAWDGASLFPSSWKPTVYNQFRTINSENSLLFISVLLDTRVAHWGKSCYSILPEQLCCHSYIVFVCWTVRTRDASN